MTRQRPARLIVLDFDGVLNSTGLRPRAVELRKGLEPMLIARVAQLVEDTDARVVISSSWRHVHDLDRLRDLLVELPPDRIVGVTPDLPTRGQEIAHWLTYDFAHPTRLVIFDDNDGGMFDMRPMRRWFVKTDGQRGISRRDVDDGHGLLTRGPVFDARTFTGRLPARAAARPVRPWAFDDAVAL